MLPQKSYAAQPQFPRIMVIDENGTNLGTMSYRDARQAAEERGLDLVKVGHNALGDIHKIMDRGKMEYEKKKAAKNQSHAPKMKEMQFGTNIGQHDLQVKINHIHDFLHKGSPVRIIIKMRGRERSHPELAAELLNKVLESLTESEILNPVKKSDGQLMVIIKMSSDHGKNEKSFGNNGD